MYNLEIAEMNEIRGDFTQVTINDLDDVLGTRIEKKLVDDKLVEEEITDYRQYKYNLNPMKEDGTAKTAEEIETEIIDIIGVKIDKTLKQKTFMDSVGTALVGKKLLNCEKSIIEEIPVVK